MKKETDPAMLTKERAPDEYFIEGDAAETIRVTNRMLVQLKLTLSEMVLTEEYTNKQLDQLKDKKTTLIEDVSKKTQELQGVINDAATKFGINITEGWKIDLEKLRLFR